MSIDGDEWTWTFCGHCGGTGWVEMPGDHRQATHCPTCEGKAGRWCTAADHVGEEL